MVVYEGMYTMIVSINNNEIAWYEELFETITPKLKGTCTCTEVIGYCHVLKLATEFLSQTKNTIQFSKCCTCYNLLYYALLVTCIQKEVVHVYRRSGYSRDY